VSTNDAVDARTPEDPVVLSDVGNRLLTEAASSGSGTAAVSLTPSAVTDVTQTVVAVTAGHTLDASHWNGPATVLTVTGTAQVADGDGTVDLGTGQLARLRAGAGSIRADEDLVVLLTVAPR
jgi:hypothetical protein